MKLQGAIRLGLPPGLQFGARASVLAAGVAMAMLATPARSQPPGFPMYWYLYDTPWLYASMGAHSYVFESFTWTRSTVGFGFDGLPADVHWSHPLFVSQWQNGAASGRAHDGVDIVGRLVHVIAPHGEPVNPDSFRYGFNIDAGAIPLGSPPTYINGTGWVGVQTDAFPHPPLGHMDNFWAGARYWIYGAPDSPPHELLAYLWLVVGMHTSGPVAWRGGGAAYAWGAAQGTSQAGGIIGVIADNQTLQGVVAVALGGIPRNQFMSAHLHDQTGAVVLDLPPVNQWVNLGQNGLGLVLDAPLPLQSAQAVAELRKWYLDVHTFGFPGGEVRGDFTLQTVDVDLPAAPTLALAPPRPNPSRSSAAIGFTLPQGGHVTLRIYDARGALVATLADGPLGPGQHEILWDGRDDAGRAVGAGVYFLQLEAAGQRATAKLLRLE